MSDLREQNKALTKENASTSATLHSHVADLQRQMTEALSIALQKNASLSAKLEEAENTIAELQGLTVADESIIVGEEEKSV